MKLKNLTKKIRRLEARLEEGAKKLVKLKSKLGAATTAAGKTKKKLGARAAKSSTRTQKKKAKPATKKVKKKLNLSPERRAQLAAAMKARWAAKRAAADVSQQDSSTNRDFTLGPNPQGA